MKKYKIYGYLGLAITISVLAYAINNSISKANDKEVKIEEKVLVEISYIEKNITKMINLMNNISDDMYTISTIEVKSSEQTSEDEEESDTDVENGETKEEYTLEETEETTVNWDEIRKIIKEIYVSIPIITLDLNEVGVDTQTILEFNKSFDKLNISVQNEERKNAIINLVNIYDNVTKLLPESEETKMYLVMLNTKKEIFFAYAQLEDSDWEKMDSYLLNALSIYNEIYLDYEMDDKENVSVNKCFVMLNELKSCVELEDRETFLIKYKNLLAEMQNL